MSSGSRIGLNLDAQAIAGKGLADNIGLSATKIVTAPTAGFDNKFKLNSISNLGNFDSSVTRLNENLPTNNLDIQAVKINTDISSAGLTNIGSTIIKNEIPPTNLGNQLDLGGGSTTKVQPVKLLPGFGG